MEPVLLIQDGGLDEGGVENNFTDLHPICAVTK